MNQTIKTRIEKINNGEVPEGYKKTSFGIFPCDWEKNKKLNEFCDINPKALPMEDKIIYIDLECVVDGRLNCQNVILKYDAPSRAQRVLNLNDVLYQMVRPYQKNNFIYMNKLEYQAVASTGYSQLRSSSYKFLFQIINSNYFCIQVLDKCIGTNYPAINSSSLREVKIAYPCSAKEQEKIAEILMKWDEMVEAQEGYIKALELRKKALMRKLLTPKEGWSFVKLGDICKITTGKLNANELVENGRYPFFTCAKQVYFINSYAFNNEALLMAGNGEIGDIKYYKGKFNAYQRTYVLYDFIFPIKYAMHYLLKFFNKEVMHGLQKSSMPYIKLGLLKNVKVYYNSDAGNIEKILSTADEEIQLQKQKLAEIKQQRKSLQQLLLTGIARVNYA